MRARLRLLMTVQVALLGSPVSQSLSPRMQNAAFAARGLDWHYTAFDVEDVVGAVGALRTLGFAGANVTIPHKQAVVAACDEADGEAVNTLVFRDGRVLGLQHRPRDPRRDRVESRLRDRCGRRGARAASRAARQTREVFTRSASGRPMRPAVT